jgi:hypothetical protein
LPRVAPARVCVVRTRGSKLAALVRTLPQSVQFVCLAVHRTARPREDRQIERIAALLRNVCVSLAHEEVKPRAIHRARSFVAANPRRSIKRIRASFLLQRSPLPRHGDAFPLSRVSISRYRNEGTRGILVVRRRRSG